MEEPPGDRIMDVYFRAARNFIVSVTAVRAAGRGRRPSVRGDDRGLAVQ